MDINAMDEEWGRVYVDLMGKEPAKRLHIPESSKNPTVTLTDTRQQIKPDDTSTTSDEINNKTAKNAPASYLAIISI